MIVPKAEKPKAVNFRLPKDMVQSLKVIADRTDQSLNAVVIYLLDWAIEQENKDYSESLKKTK